MRPHDAYSVIMMLGLLTFLRTNLGKGSYGEKTSCQKKSLQAFSARFPEQTGRVSTPGRLTQQLHQLHNNVDKKKMTEHARNNWAQYRLGELYIVQLASKENGSHVCIWNPLRYKRFSVVLSSITINAIVLPFFAGALEGYAHMSLEAPMIPSLFMGLILVSVSPALLNLMR